MPTILVVEDTLQDARTQQNPVVSGPPHLRCGAWLRVAACLSAAASATSRTAARVMASVQAASTWLGQMGLTPLEVCRFYAGAPLIASTGHRLGTL